MKDNRVFYSVLQRVGSDGKYQTISLVMCSLILMVCGSSTFFNAFLFYQEPYTCNDLSEANCKTYICSLPQQQRSIYINKNVGSLASKFGDFRCQRQDELNSAQTFIYSGGMVGVILGLLFRNLVTKKQLLVISFVSNLIGIIITITGCNLFMASLGLFINFAAKGIENQIIPCFISETVSDQAKGRHIMVIYIFYAIGVTLNGVFFKYIRQWQVVLIVFIIIPVLAALVMLLKYIQQTPMELIINSSPEQSLKKLNRIASINNREFHHHLTIRQLQNIKRQYQQNEEQKHNYSISFFDLFRYSSLRLITVLVIFLHFLISFQFHASQLALKDYQMDIYLNGVIIGASQLGSAAVCYFIVDFYKRKDLLYITEIISLVVAVNICLFFTCQQKHCSNMIQIIQTGGLFFYRFLTTISFNIFFIIQFQIFPTQIRSIGLQTSAIAANFALVVVPQIMYICQKIGVTIVSFYAICSILVVIFTIKLPQTFGIPPPEIIQQLKYEHFDIQEK